MSERRTKTQRRSKAQAVEVPPPVKPLLQAIGRLAEEQGVRAYAVGGCVRDWLLGIATITDLDVTVEGDGIAFARQVASALGASVKPHEQFGTAVLELPASGAGASVPHHPEASQLLRIDVASCRREVYPEPAAYPKVSAGKLRDDLFRRDFTINAMAMAITPEEFGRLIDPFGGLKDLQARRLRVLHPRSFRDDPSRILRGVRFAQRYGLSLEPQTSRALRRATTSGVMARLNRGRLRKELDRMVEEPDSIACLALLGTWLRA